jgi:WD40 repeat protein
MTAVTWIRVTCVLLLVGLLGACGVVRSAQVEQDVGTPVETQPTLVAGEHAIDVSNVAALEEVRVIRASSGPIYVLAFSPIDNRLATLGQDRTVRIWAAETGDLLAEPYQHHHLGTGLSFSPDGGRLLSAGGAVGQDVVVLDLDSGEVLGTASADGFYIHDAVWAPDGGHFILVSEGSSRIYVIDTEAYRRVPRRSSGIPLTSAAHTAGLLAVTNAVGSTYIYTLTGPGAYTLQREMRYDVNLDLSVDDDVAGRDLAFSPNGAYLANCFRDGQMIIWRTTDWVETAAIAAHSFVPDEVEGCWDGAFSRGSDVYLTGGDDGWLRAWDAATGDALAAFDFGIPVTALSISGDGKLLAAGLVDGTLHLLALPAGQAAT